MPKGETTTLRESGKPEPYLQKIYGYHASEMEELQANVLLVDQPFEADGHTYRIERVRRDTIHRLIAIGKLKRDSHE